MDVREKLVELLSYFADGYSVENRHIVGGQRVCEIADHLISHGVTVQDESNEIKQLKNQVVALKKSNRNWRRKVQRMRNRPQPPKGE